MLELGQTVDRSGGAEFGCRLSGAGRVHRRPEPLTPSEDAIGGIGVRIVDVEMSSEMLSWLIRSPLGRHLRFGRSLGKLGRDARVAGSAAVPNGRARKSSVLCSKRT
jgi:hypothetical protein